MGLNWTLVGEPQNIGWLLQEQRVTEERERVGSLEKYRMHYIIINSCHVLCTFCTSFSTTIHDKHYVLIYSLLIDCLRKTAILY